MLDMIFPSPVFMHIPDGFLSVLVSIIFWIVSIPVIGVALKKVNRQLAESKVPLMGVMAAAIFAGQMLNFTVAGGTSGHLLGAALAAILLGPWAAVLVMTAVVTVQALIFQDGGILALGANLFNMAVIGTFVSYAVYSLFTRFFKNYSRGHYVAGFIAAWMSIVIASLSCGLQLAASGTTPANIAVPAMATVHALIGIGEGLITLGALIFIQATRKDLLISSEVKAGSNRGVLIGGSLIAILLAVLSPIASSHPDGLERVAENLGFIELAKEAVYKVIPDYVVPGINNPALATIVAGVIGTIIVFGLAFGIAGARRKPIPQENDDR